ncbi:MAG: HEAT repeat domain-containing protein [Pirellulales bacterium]|nr:HEAT repeat domain-containing protein [Pirellulales bacterium]
MADDPEKIPPQVGVDELLPPVEAPSGAFIMQLFIIPAVIVAAIVGAWLLINSLARRDQLAPDDVVARLRSQNPSRFQVANDLADMLRMPERYPDVRPDADLAAALGKLLDEMVAAGDDSDASVSMRTLLCGFLGEFSVTDGALALVNAAKNDPEPSIRRKAIGSLAVLAQTLADRQPPEALELDGLADVLIAAANQPDDDALRSETAFALGVLASVPGADSRYTDELVKLLDDFYPDARYNAANGLARTGNLAAVDTVAEMLDLDAIQGSVATLQPFNDQVTPEALAVARAEKRDMILINAVKSARTLHEQNPDAKFEKLASGLETLIAASPQIPAPGRVSPTLVKAAEQVLGELRGPGR